MKRLLALALFTAVACHHPLASPADAGQDAGGSDGGADAGQTFPSDAGPVVIAVRAIFPGHGPAAGGTSALVSGAGFVNGFAARGGAAVSAQTAVTIGGAPATSIDVIDDNRLQLVTPAGAGGPADVVVTNPNGSGTCAGCFRYQAALGVSSITPALGATQGGTPVLVKGAGFAPGMLLLVGGRSLINLVVTDASTASGLAPPGAPGGADVLALTHDAKGELRRGFVYADSLTLAAVDPAVGPTAGGTQLLLTGTGFSALAAVTIGGVAAPTLWVDAQHLAVTAPAHAAGPADVSVADPGSLSGGGASLPRGYLYADDVTSLSVNSVSPIHGPLAGGTCPQTCLTIWGTGLAQAGLTAQVGGAAATLRDAQPTRLRVDLPAGAQPGPADVTVTAGGASASLPAAFRYDAALAVINISPAVGLAAGGTAINVSGVGFAPGQTVLIGALPATSVVVAGDGRSLSAITPAGAPGPADVTIVAADGTTATLPGGFTYSAPLLLAQVDPAQGSQAGGTRVTLYGQGFAAGMAVAFGGKPATDLSVLGPSLATVRTPRGDPGAVEVAATLGAQRDALAQGFTFFDPSSAPGGLGGGPLRGALNVTVFESSAFLSGGVHGATVVVELGAGGRLTGTTDDRGQLTFADERLDLPCSVTVTKDQYNAITVGSVQTEDVSVYLSGPAGPPPPPPDPPPPPPPPRRPATIGGHVFGFKAPPDLQLRPGQRLVARVLPASSSVYSAPPFTQEPKFLTVAADGGAWGYSTASLSPTTVYALFGIEDRATTPPGFTPLLLGIRRGISPNPDKPVTDADIILDTHLDQSVVASVLGVPSTPRGPVGHDAAVDLDLGNDGVIPLAHVVQAAPLDQLRFSHLPAASGQGFVFVDQVGLWTGSGITLPATTYLRRVFSDPGPGLVLGPLLSFPVLLTPASGGALGPSGFTWQLDGQLQPNLVQLNVNGGSLAWGVVLPGSARQVSPPPEIAARLSPATYVWSVTASLSPAFDYAHWTYNDLYSGTWTAYAYDVLNFTVAP